MTNLEFFCQVFKWQGGTVYQVSDELKRVLGSKEYLTVSSIVDMGKASRELVKDLYLVKRGIK